MLYSESLGGYWLGYERTTLPRIYYKYLVGYLNDYLYYYIQGTGGSGICVGSTHLFNWKWLYSIQFNKQSNHPSHGQCI